MNITVLMKASDDASQQEDEWDFLRQRKKTPRSQTKLPKVFFLTEEAARCEGEFSKRRQQILDARHKPQAYNEKMGRTTQSVMAIIGSESGSTSRSTNFGSGRYF